MYEKQHSLDPTTEISSEQMKHHAFTNFFNVLNEMKTLETLNESSEWLTKRIHTKVENLLKLILENSLETVKDSEHFQLFDNVKEKKEINKLISNFSLNIWCKILLCCIQCCELSCLMKYVVDWLHFLILGLRQDGGWDRKSLEKEWEDEKTLHEKTIDSADISYVIKAITQNFLFQVELDPNIFNKALSWTNQEKTCFVLKYDCSLRVTCYCQVIHNILTSYGINECDKTLLKQIFSLQQNHFTKNTKIYQNDACLRISDLLVSRNALSGKIQCKPLSFKCGDIFLNHDDLKKIQTKYLHSEINPKHVLVICTKTEQVVNKITTTILSSLQDIQNDLTLPQEILPYFCLILLPLIARLLSIQNISCQIISIQSFQFLVTYTPFVFISKLFDSLVIILQKCYPFFLTTTHDIKKTIEYFGLYLKTWITLLSLPFDFSFHSCINSCLDFLFSRFVINIVPFPERLIPVLKHFKEFIQQKPFFSVDFVKEFFLIAFQAMESDHYHLCVMSTEFIQTLVRSLPRFCTQLYWKDICVRIVLLKSRIEEISLVDNEIKATHIQHISKLSFLLDQLIQEMKKKFNTQYLQYLTIESQAFEKKM